MICKFLIPVPKARSSETGSRLRPLFNLNLNHQLRRDRAVSKILLRDGEKIRHLQGARLQQKERANQWDVFDGRCDV